MGSRNSRPASSASRAASRFSNQPASQRSGAVVANEPEQFMPNKPSLKRFPLSIRVARVITSLIPWRPSRSSTQCRAKSQPLQSWEQLVANDWHFLDVVHGRKRHAVEPSISKPFEGRRNLIITAYHRECAATADEALHHGFELFSRQRATVAGEPFADDGLGPFPITLFVNEIVII